MEINGIKTRNKLILFLFFNQYNGRVNFEAQEFWISDLGKSRSPEYKSNDQRVPFEMTKS